MERAGSLRWVAPDGAPNHQGSPTSSSSSSGRHTKEREAAAGHHLGQQQQQQQRKKKKPVGTPWYNSPGQQQGESHGPYTDVYSAAAHLWKLLGFKQYGMPLHNWAMLQASHAAVKAAQAAGCAQVFAACFVPHQVRWSLRRLLAEVPYCKRRK
jgi:serine/threonine protein kinase